MSIEREIVKRSGSKCELCGSGENLGIYNVPPSSEGDLKDSVHICATCESQIEDSAMADGNHWRCLYESMWSEVSAVKVLSWRMLSRLKSEDWTADLLDQMYMEEDELSWAKSTEPDEDALVHIDSNGVVLESGDSVVLIKDLKVKGGGFTAKRGTAVRRISLSHENPKHIEGKVEGQTVVLLTDYVKKTK